MTRAQRKRDASRARNQLREELDEAADSLRFTAQDLAAHRRYRLAGKVLHITALLDALLMELGEDD